MHHPQVSCLLEALHLRGSKCQKIPNCYAPDAFHKFKLHQNSFSVGSPPQTPLGELTTLLRLSSRLEMGIPLRIIHPLDTFGVSILAPCEHSPKINPSYGFASTAVDIVTVYVAPCRIVSYLTFFRELSSSSINYIVDVI